MTILILFLTAHMRRACVMSPELMLHWVLHGCVKCCRMLHWVLQVLVRWLSSLPRPEQLCAAQKQHRPLLASLFPRRLQTACRWSSALSAHRWGQERLYKPLAINIVSCKQMVAPHHSRFHTQLSRLKTSQKHSRLSQEVGRPA